MEDSIEEVYFFMNENNQFVYLTKKYKILKNYSNYHRYNLITDCKNCETECEISKNVLHYYERSTAGIAHCVAKISTYLRLIMKYRGVIIIPNCTNQNVINLINGIFQNFIILQPNIRYVFKKFVHSAYLNIMENPFLMKPDNKYPLIIYNNDIYWFRSHINKYIDKIKNKEKYDKIFVGKFEGQASNNSSDNLTKPRSILGCVYSNLLHKFEKNGFRTIDPYKYHIHDVIYYIRNAKEVILSIGTCSHLYAPFLKSNCKLYFLTNVLHDQGISFNNLKIDYNEKADIVQRFFPVNTKICFYKYAPHFDTRVTEDNYYKGEDMLDFLK